MHPEVLLDNPSFASILAAQNKGDWSGVATILAGAINRMAAAGAEVAIIPANSAHFAYDKISKMTSIPVINIVEITADECVRLVYKRVAVLGVGLTMSGRLYDEQLNKRGIVSIALAETQQKRLNDIIYSELINGSVVDTSVREIVSMLVDLNKSGCDAVLLACTELPVAINKTNTPLPYIDTTALLAEKAVEISLT